MGKIDNSRRVQSSNRGDQRKEKGRLHYWTSDNWNIYWKWNDEDKILRTKDVPTDPNSLSTPK